MKRNSKQFLALFMAVAMSVTPVSYAYAEDSAVAGVENTESGQQTVEVTDGKIGAADAAGQSAEEVTGQEEETTAGQGTDENQKSQEEPKAEENAATGNVTEAEKKEQKILRTEYMDSVKRNLRSQLNNIDIEEKDRSVINLGEKYGNKKGH